MKHINIVYFAQLAEALGTGAETIALPEHVKTLGQLQHYLAARESPWAAVAEPHIRTAVNKTLCKGHHPIGDGDEVAFFPPVTGG